MKRILLVDDDGDMLAMTERWLTKAGYEVSVATSGDTALELLSGQLPDLVLLDYAMPGMNGPAVLKAIRSDDRLASLKVLYRTGMEDGDLMDESSSVRPDGVVPKSEGKPALIRAIEGVLS